MIEIRQLNATEGLQYLGPWSRCCLIAWREERRLASWRRFHGPLLNLFSKRLFKECNKAIAYCWQPLSIPNWSEPCRFCSPRLSTNPIARMSPSCWSQDRPGARNRRPSHGARRKSQPALRRESSQIMHCFLTEHGATRRSFGNNWCSAPDHGWKPWPASIREGAVPACCYRRASVACGRTISLRPN